MQYKIDRDPICNEYAHIALTIDSIGDCPMCGSPFRTALKNFPQSDDRHEIYIKWQCKSYCIYDPVTKTAVVRKSDQCWENNKESPSKVGIVNDNTETKP